MGGGFVVTPRSLQTGGENIFYKQTDRDQADAARRQQNHGIADARQLSLPSNEAGGQDIHQNLSRETTKWALPPLPFATGKDLLALCSQHNLTIAQVVWENEQHYLTDEEIRSKTLALWKVMDTCIREGGL